MMMKFGQFEGIMRLRHSCGCENLLAFDGCYPVVQIGRQVLEDVDQVVETVLHGWVFHGEDSGFSDRVSKHDGL